MAQYARETRIRAPLERVWSFSVRPAGLVAVTPDWFGLRVEAVSRSAGSTDGTANRDEDLADTGEPALDEPLEEGSVVQLSVRPFGVGPRQRWRSEIVVCRRDGDGAVFRDRMVDGPFEHWEHTHRFDAVEGGTATVLRDRVAYRFPGGPVGPLVSRLAVVGLEPTFRYRHRRTREMVEEGDWTGW